ncbi:MAG: MBL fold metallo-hydrolase [Candidatus Eiseniibacteriota bacterium]|nr:MAG: MBL fold metallo-hydrolase [Candidatus Eisenbacteria bacterium]
MLKKIHWLGHASFRIEGETTVYFDPFRLKKGAAAADVICVSHSHSDHCSPEDIKLIQKKETVLVTTSDCVKKLSGEVVTVKPGDTLTVKGLKIQVVPAYNTNKKFHPRDKGWVGFVVTVEGQRVYHTGDTDFIPEMKKLDVDVALLPVSGTYVMTAEEAAQAAKAIAPRLAIPMHYGTIVGDEKDALTFKEKSGVRVEILRRETR